jgi:WD40 repeat protein
MDVWLTKENRTISTKQREVVSKAFLPNSQPLYLRLLFHHTQHWNSYTSTSDIIVATSTSEAIQQFFTSLEDQYGRTLVRRALGCITAAKSGLTEAELEDVLSLDNDVLNEVYQYWDPPDRGILRLPALLWKRIRYELSDYLVEQHADGKTVFAWYHRQFIESAKTIYLKDEETRLSIHQALSEYYEGTWSGKECKPITLVHRNLNLDDASREVAPQPIQFSEKVYNIRKLKELPYHLLLSKQLEKLKIIVLCNFHWLHTKITITSFQSVLQDFTLALSHTNDSDISTIGEALSLSASNLMSDPDSFAGQLLGRLNSFKAQSQHIHTLTEQACHWAVTLSEKHQLIPHNNCLISPGGPLKTTLLAHPQLIQALSMTSSGSFMISSSKGDNCSIFNVWDVRYLPQNVQNLHTLKIANSGTPHFCSVNEFFFGSSGQTVTAWNCLTGEKVFTLRTLNSVTSLTPTHDEKYLIIGMADGSLLCYDRVSGNSFESHAHDDGIHCMDSLENGSIVTTSRSGQLGVYDTNLHKYLQVLQAHSSAIVCMTSVSSSDESYVLTGSDDKIAKVWLVAGENVQLLQTLAGHTKTVKCITCVHTDIYLAMTGSLDKTIRIWDATLNGTCLRTLEGHLDGIWCLATLPDGLRLVSGSKDDNLKVWNISTGECLHTLEGHSSWVSCAVVPSTDIVISGSNDKNIKIWKLGSTKSSPTDRHFAQPECILSTSNGLVVSGAPDAIKVWDIISARCLQTFSTAASCLCTTDDGRYLISGSKDFTINIWNLESYSRVRTIKNHFGATTCLAMVDNNTYLSSHADGMLALRCLCTDNYKIMSGHTGSIKCMLVSKDRCIAASGSYDCTVRVWNILTADCAAILTGHDEVVWSVAISSDNSLLASGGDDATVRIWSLSENCCLHHIARPANVKCVAISLNDKVVIAGAHCSQNQLKAYNSTTGECVSNYKGHTHAVMCMKVVDGCTVITGSRDGTVKVWDITTGELFAVFDLQSQVKHIAIISKSVDKHQVSLAATTKTGPIALLNYYYP